jgi:Cof subfamily protein (haloacid dehalogenase superfamily)
MASSRIISLLERDRAIAMKIHMVAIDLDGTLLNSDKEITQTTATILRAAREQAGVKIVLATARPPRSVMPFYNLLDLDTPMINYNGALVIDPTCQHVLMHRPIPAKVSRGIIQLARRTYPEVLVSAEVMDHWFTDRFDPAYNTETGRLFPPDTVAPVESWTDQSMTKLLFLGAPARLPEVAEAIHREFPHQVTIVQTEDYMLQVMHATVSKAQALRVVAAEMHVRRNQVMAIGDNANDVGMLQWAGVAVAMANAAPQALAVADHIADHHDADGAAHAIRQIILEGLPPNRGRKQ